VEALSTARTSGPGRGAGLRGSAGRAGWALADQAVSSLTNFALSVAVARSVGAEDFGAFGIAFTSYLIALGFTRAVSSEPLLVRLPGLEGRERDRAVAEATGAAVVVGVVAGLACVGTGLVSGGPAGTALVTLGVCLPGLLAQDTLRHVFFAEARPRSALVNDLVWAAAQVAAIGWLVLTGSATLGALTLAWGSAAALAALLGVRQARCRPRPTGTLAWLRTQRDLVPPFVGEFVARNGARYATLFVVGAVAGLAALGAVRAVQVLTGPATVVLLGAAVVAIPELVRLRDRRPRQLGAAVAGLAAGLCGLALALGLAPLLLPDAAGEALFGEVWTLAQPLIVPQALFLASMGATSGYLGGLRALEAANRSFAARLVVTVLVLAGGVVGTLVGDARGAMIGLALANTAGVALWRGQFRRALTERHDRCAVSSRSPGSGHTAPERGDPGGIGDRDAGRDAVDGPEEVADAVQLGT
jgi:O-antigen/teichoic acid export membrane protein